MSQNLYAYADLGREGLGNLLVPWAKAEVFSKEHGVPMLAPQWTQPKVGPLLRGERDKRYYLGLLDNSGYIRGIRKQLILASATKIPGEKFAGANGKQVVFFRGCEGGLTGLGEHQALVRARLEAILAPRIKQLLQTPETYEITAHVRRGDRPPRPFGSPFRGDDDWIPGMPDEWFINCINSIRQSVGRSVPVRIFSDAKPGQIDRILSLPNIDLAPPNPSIVDMFLMSRAKVLITTGTSTFSAWSSFLGGALTIYYPGLIAALKPDWPGGSIETDLSGRLDDVSARAVRDALA